MKNDLLSSLKIYIKENGKDALDNIGTTGSYIYTNTDSKYMDECEVLMICLTLGYHKILIESSQSEQFSVKKNNFAEYLNNNEGLDLNLCNRTLDILETALFETEMPVEENKDEQNKNLIEEINQLKNKKVNQNATPIPDEFLIKEKLGKTKFGLIATILLGVIGMAIMGIVIYNKNKEPEHLRSQLSDLQNRYNTLQNNNSILQNRYDTLQSNNTMLQNRYNALQRDYENAKAVSKITVTAIRVGNWSDSTWLTNPGGRLQSSQMRYLAPVITYNSTINENVTFYCKIIRPNGTLDTGRDSPSGFSYSTTERLNRGNDQSLRLSGWGNSNASPYPAGEYTVEVWYNDVLLRAVSEKVTIHP
jgi:hypothetical protein